MELCCVESWWRVGGGGLCARGYGLLLRESFLGGPVLRYSLLLLPRPGVVDGSILSFGGAAPGWAPAAACCYCRPGGGGGS